MKMGGGTIKLLLPVVALKWSSVMDNEVLDAAISAPKLFVDASLGKGEEYSRDPGFQLTKEQIINLRKYEVLGLSLPREIDDIIVYLDYGKGDAGSPGLTAHDFQGTFRTTYDHARRWSPLCIDIKLTGTDLKIFAGSILGLGNAIVDLYDEQKASKYLEEHGIDTVEKYLSQKVESPELPSLEMSAGDVKDLKYFLDRVLEKVDAAHKKALEVRGEIERFATDMRESVLPEIKLRLKAVSDNTYQQDIKDLQKKIDERSDEIDALSKQYDKLVKDAIMAAASLNIGGLVLGIYTGVKAEEIRKQRNALKAVQESDNLLMASKNKTLTSLNRIRGDLQELRDVTIEADVATQNLMFVWSSLSRFIIASKEDADLLTDTLTLRRFKNQVLSIAEPWNEIKSGADQLLNVFAEAEKEYLTSQLPDFGNKTTLKAFSAPDISVFDVEKLRAFNTRAQDANVTAQMLFEQWAFQQGRVEKINALALAVGRITAGLRAVSDSTSFDLQQAKNKLLSLQEELKSAADAEVDEVGEDIQVEFRKLSAKLVAQFDQLRNANKDLLEPYNRDDSAQLTKTLLGDKEYAEQRNKELEVQRKKSRAQIASLSDGIDVVAKAGIEKIGQQVELTKDKVVELGVAPPQVAVVMLAIDTLKNLLADAAEIVSYLNLVAELNRQKDKLAGLNEQFDNNARGIQRVQGQIDLLEALDKVDEERSGYVKVYSSFLAYFEKLSSQFDGSEAQTIDDKVEDAIARIDQDLKYLKPLTL